MITSFFKYSCISNKFIARIKLCNKSYFQAEYVFYQYKENERYKDVKMYANFQKSCFGYTLKNAKSCCCIQIEYMIGRFLGEVKSLPFSHFKITGIRVKIKKC